MIEKKIKIAYLIDTIFSDKAGTEKQLFEIIRRLDRATFDPILVCLYATPWMLQNDLPLNYHILGYSGFIKPNFHQVIKRLARFLQEQQIDIMQTLFLDSIFIGYLGSFFCSPRPVLLSSRRDIGLGNDEPWYHFLIKAFLPVVNKRFCGIITNSNEVRDYVIKRERTNKEKIKVINNGIELPTEQLDMPDIFPTIKADLWIGITANLKQIKRVDIFLKGLALVKKNSRVKFHALVLGEGPEKERLSNLAQDLGLSSTVHFMGSVNNVYAYLKYMDIGVLCSDREGLSNAIMEYMASGLPVIATAVGGNTELVDKHNGILVPSGNEDALADALIKLSNDPYMRKEMGKISKMRIMEAFSWDKIMTQWESYYYSMVQSMACKSKDYRICE